MEVDDDLCLGADVTRATISSLSADGIYMISLATRSDDGTGDESGALIARPRTAKLDDRPVLVVYSYKEGILVGVCIAALCLAVCAFVLYVRFRYALLSSASLHRRQLCE